MLKEIKLKKEISNITNLGTNTGLTAVENKLPNVLSQKKKKKTESKKLTATQKLVKLKITLLLLNHLII